MNRKYLHFGLAILALAVVGCGQKPDATAEEPKPKDSSKSIELSKDAEKIAGIETAKVESQLMQTTLDVPGVVVSTTKGHAIVTPPVAGKLISINAQVGDVVKHGQTIAVLIAPELAQMSAQVAESRRARDMASAEVRQAISEVDLAVAKLSSAKITLTRQQDLAKAGAFSQAPLQQAQTELNDAQTELLSIQKELNSHSEQLRRTENLLKEGLVSKSDYEAAKLEVQQDQIRFDRATSRVENAKRTYEREKGISGKGLLNARELQAAEAEVRTAQIEREKANLKVRSARAEVANAEKAIRNAESTYRTLSGNSIAGGGQVTIVAPISGTITHLDVTRGQAVDRTQVLMEVENLDAVWVTAHLPEADASKVAKGGMVKITAAAIPNRQFEGVVQVIGGRIDPKTRSLPVQCLVAGSNGALRPDMFATVHLGIGTRTKAVAVPKTALVTEDRKSFVFVKVDGKFEKREIEIGRTDDTLVEVRSGLKEGEEIAVEGEFVLKSESKKDELKGDD
ncbi:MAG: efflux RND transporter periplasmic adaptor subunit [Armatimonadetes bacterium]|nr:efflux RND transporter periplasmic adaptor subunit [Armatimonadota bacterium]